MPKLTVTLTELRELAQENFDEAKEVADDLGLPTVVKAARVENYQMSYESRNASSFSDVSSLRSLRKCQGLRAWGAMMSYDIRQSSKRATRIGPKSTYITMHTLIPTLLAVVKSAEGISVGLRGDGGIATFGMVEVKKGSSGTVTPKQAELAVRMACKAGTAMIKAVQKVINPVLVEGGIEGDIHLGVGIDVGEFVATNIGYKTATDLTAYGDCVNKACKHLSQGTDVVVLSNDAKNMFPSSEGGKTSFRRFGDKNDAYVLHYPADYKVIE